MATRRKARISQSGFVVSGAASVSKVTRQGSYKRKVERLSLYLSWISPIVERGIWRLVAKTCVEGWVVLPFWRRVGSVRALPSLRDKVVGKLMLFLFGTVLVRSGLKLDLFLWSTVEE